MIKVLLVDDDAVVLEAYRQKLAAQGFDVLTASDGLEAMRALPLTIPDVVVLDLMMPRFSGFEVIRYIRANASLKATRIVVLSNFYVGAVERRAAEAEADALLMKFNCTPALLLDAVNRALNNPAQGKSVQPVVQATAAPKVDSESRDLQLQAFREIGRETLATLRQLNDAFVLGDSQAARVLRLLDFYRKAHFLTATAAMAGRQEIALLSGVFEALLFELHQKPNFITPSTLQTIAYTLDFFRLLMADAGRGAASTQTWKALVVDDDPVSVRALVGALSSANLVAVGERDPAEALKQLGREQFGLVLLDIEMPGMGGFELCEKIRQLPNYKRTPVIFVTGHADFDNRIHSVLSGGNDLIAKPVFPIELAVKAVTHLLRSQLPESWGLA
jgi:CheY-like chemotaxis protein